MCDVSARVSLQYGARPLKGATYVGLPRPIVWAADPRAKLGADEEIFDTVLRGGYTLQLILKTLHRAAQPQAE